tara:strand:- start:12236 stop:12478 length:243 start_codon:yes stop_codon:yes gene_type:complete
MKQTIQTILKNSPYGFCTSVSCLRVTLEKISMGINPSDSEDLFVLSSRDELDQLYDNYQEGSVTLDELENELESIINQHS